MSGSESAAEKGPRSQSHWTVCFASDGSMIVAAGGTLAADSGCLGSMPSSEDRLLWSFSASEFYSSFVDRICSGSDATF
jgi:hypothetical protein